MGGPRQTAEVFLAHAHDTSEKTAGMGRLQPKEGENGKEIGHVPQVAARGGKGEALRVLAGDGRIQRASVETAEFGSHGLFGDARYADSENSRGYPGIGAKKCANAVTCCSAALSHQAVAQLACTVPLFLARSSPHSLRIRRGS